MAPLVKDGKTILNQSLDYGYAHTIHKSQGGTYNKVLILEDTIDSFQSDAVRQELKYVAVSRATTQVYIATSKKLGTPEIVEELRSTQPLVQGTSSNVKVVSSDYGVVVAETNPTKEFDQKLANAIYNDVAENAYVENGSKTSQRMWANGFMWKGNNTKKPTGKPLKVVPAQVDYNANGKLKPVSTPYFYDPLYNDGTPVAPISNLDFLKKHIEATLGIDMSDYDVSLNNIYEEGHNLFRHTDIDESNTAKNYPVIVYVFGNTHKVRFDDNGGKRAMGQMVNPKTLTLKNGDIYTFGMDGKGRFETVHDVVASPKTDANYPTLIGSDGKPTNKYTVTFTFRRAADLEPGMPTSPAKLGTTAQPTVQGTDLSSVVNHSGGAYGGDTFWDIIGREFGVTEHRHYRESSNVGLSKKLKNAGVQATVLTKEQMDTARAEVERLLGKSYPDTREGNLQVRNYYQVANADAVYAVAALNNKKDAVSGGTNTAVQLAIKLNKPVYVWDINTRSWYLYTNGTFVSTGTPRLTQNFAGVGSRDIELFNVKDESGNWVPRPQYKGQDVEDAAKQAIREVYQKTINEGLQITKVTNVSDPNVMNKGVVKNNLKGLNLGTQLGTDVPVYYFSLLPGDFKPAEIATIVKFDPNAIYVSDTVMAKPGKTLNTSGLQKSNAILAVLGESNYFGIPTKFTAAPFDTKTGRPIVNVDKTTGVSTPIGLLSDEEYDYNVQQIEAAITALKEKLALNPGMFVRFSNSGVGQSMISHSEFTSRPIQPTDKNIQANPKTAEKTFVYLSKRLYEEFGYINPNSMPRKFAKGSIEMTEKVERDQEISDTQINNDLLNDILSCSI